MNPNRKRELTLYEFSAMLTFCIVFIILIKITEWLNFLNKFLIDIFGTCGPIKQKDIHEWNKISEKVENENYINSN